MISVLILTKNEAQDLPGCLQSISWCDDIHVFDSFSDDETVTIAKKYGAIVTQRKFDNYASQRNSALDHLVFKYPWLFILDADERTPEILITELKELLINVDHNVSGFRIRRKDFLNDTWLKYSQISPFYIRLIRVGKARYHREINEVLEVDGDVLETIGYFNHYPFSKGYFHWLNKHNMYSNMEAKRWIEENDNNIEFSLKKAFFSKDFSEKRYHQKGLFYKMPGRPILKLGYLLFWRMAFLDGSAGFIYSTLQAIYEYFIVLKTKELIYEKQQ